MISVAIADDEAKICDLIYHLVDWKSLDMEVVAIAHDGMEANWVIEKYRPDIMITDIRMPGINGVDLVQKGKQCNPDMSFIIVSGYSQFEYAKNALHYGACDYLLKPINKQELLNALKNIRMSYDKIKALEKSSNAYEELRKENVKQLRKQYLIKLYASDVEEDISEEKVNKKYDFHFQNAMYQIVQIRVDGMNADENSENEFLIDKIEQILELEIVGKTFDYELASVRKGHYILILNYDSSMKKDIDTSLRKIFNQTIFQKEILEGTHITFGIGKGYNGIINTGESCKEAALAIDERIIIGVDRINYGGMNPISTKYRKYLTEIKDPLEKAVEYLDEYKIINLLMELEHTIIEDKSITGYDILRICSGVMNLFLSNVEKYNNLLEDKARILKEYSLMEADCYMVNQLFNMLRQTILTQVHFLKEKHNQEGTQTFRMAKKYIQDNYQRNISLEEISQYVGYNTSYFSVIFKKECGISFSEYVTQTRIENSKKLLKNTNETIAAIADAVGYSDIKTFNKNFKKYTGLRPGQFRKIYG